MEKQTPKTRVIIVTDGDLTAQKAVEAAARDLDLFVLNISGGNPSNLTGEQILEYILKAPYEPVVVMADDKGKKGLGPGEKIIEYLVNCSDCINIIGVVAVASNAHVGKGINVDCSINAFGEHVELPVDKEGNEEKPKHHRLEGDTVEVLKNHPELLIVGCGDPGKMNYKDTVKYGAFVTSKCFQEILERSETPHGQ